jgi:K+-sensing histidine kinase KdpD
VCKALAEAMGGNLDFVAHPEGGAVFRLRMPVMDGEEDEMRSEPQGSEPELVSGAD